MKYFYLFTFCILLFSTKGISQEYKHDSSNVYSSVEQMPAYPGCEDLKDENERKSCTSNKILGFISENVMYPKEAKDQDIEGRVFISYVVDKDGSIKDIKILRGINYLNQEAIRVISMLPRHTPAIHKGEVVPVRYNIPINFTLRGKRKKRKG